MTGLIGLRWTCLIRLLVLFVIEHLHLDVWIGVHPNNAHQKIMYLKNMDFMLGIS